MKILLIDDNRYDQELAIRALRGLSSPPGPAEIVTALHWDEAVPHLDAGGIDLILLDYNLPKLSGLDILRRLGRSRHAPVIMMTAQEDVGTAVETLRAGAHDYIVKRNDQSHCDVLPFSIESAVRLAGRAPPCACYRTP